MGGNQGQNSRINSCLGWWGSQPGRYEAKPGSKENTGERKAEKCAVEVVKCKSSFIDQIWEKAYRNITERGTYIITLKSEIT